jgi:uncharacterized protein DUF3604
MQSSKAVGFVSRLAATSVLVFTALTLAHGAKPPVSLPVKPAFEVTEDRPRCKDYNPQRRALFGTTHLHTGLSFDASIRFVDYANGNDPRGAYLFAQGKAPISIPEPSGLQPRRRASPDFSQRVRPCRSVAPLRPVGLSRPSVAGLGAAEERERSISRDP